MSIPSQYELLQDISKAIISKKNREVTNYYFKGWSENIGTTYKTIGTLQYNEIDIPTSGNQALQITSSDAGDVSLDVFIIGYDDTFTTLQEQIQTNPGNGQTAVILTNSYHRIKSMRVVSDNSNAGTIFLSKSGAAVPGGIPSIASDYIYSIGPGEKVGTILNGTIIPMTDSSMQPNYVIFSIANDSGITSEFRLQLKKTTDATWGTEFKFYIDERSNTQFLWRLDGVENIDTSTDGIDVRIQAIITAGAGTLNCSCSLSINQSTELY